MAVTFIQAAANAPVTATAVGTAFLPSSATNGDLLIMSIFVVKDTSVTAAPSNWTTITSAAVSAGINFAGVNHTFYWKHASSEPASYSATFSGADNYSTIVVAIRGQNGSVSAVHASSSNFSSSGTAVAVPAITPTVANSLWLGFGAQYSGTTTPAAWDLPAGWNLGAGITSAVAAQVVAYRTLTASGVAAAVIISASAGAAFNPWTGVSIIIAESAGAATAALIRNMSMLGVGR